MSLVSVLPFWDTLEYWWQRLEGDPNRSEFLRWKVVEVSAFIDNFFIHRKANRATGPATSVPTRKRAPLPREPRVVVVVPALCHSPRDVERLRALVLCLSRQSYPCHVIVVDDGSPEPISLPEVQVIRMSANKGPAAARNVGIAEALSHSADIIALTDADCLQDKDWIRALVDGFASLCDAHALSGATYSLDASSLGRYHERNGTLNGRVCLDGNNLLYGPTCNLALCAELASSVKFDESFRTAAAEDIDFCYRVGRQGWGIRHWPAAVVFHDFGYDGLSTVNQGRRFWRQFRKYANGERRLLRKHPEYYRAFDGSREIPCQGNFQSNRTEEVVLGLTGT